MSGLVFAASSASAIVFDIGLLKSDVSAPKTCLTRPGTTCATWSTEGDVFIGSSNGTVDRLDCKGTTIGTVFAESGSVVALAMKDKRSLIIALSQSVHLIDVTEPAGNGSLLVSTSNAIKSIGLSYDKELLAITTESGIQIYNFSADSSTPLNRRALPASTTLFHPTRRSSLIICSDSQLLILDVTKPNAPIKTITFGSPIVDATFMPGGKNLLAVAGQKGDVYIVDIDKEKAITRKTELKQSLSTISADSTLLLIGTSDGHILIHDARNLDKAMCTIPLDNTERVIALTVQKKLAPIRVTKAVANPTVLARAPPLGDSNLQRTAITTRMACKSSVEVIPVSKESRIRTTVSASPLTARKPLSRAASARSDVESVATTPVKGPREFHLKETSPIISRYVTTRQAPRRVVSAHFAARASPNKSSLPSPASSTRSRARPRKSEESVQGSEKITAYGVSPAPSKTTTRTLSPELPGMNEVSMAYQGRHSKALSDIETMEMADTTIGIAPSIAVDLSTPPKAPHSRQHYAEPKGIVSERNVGTPVKHDVAYESPGFLTPDGYHGTSTPPRHTKDSSVIRGAPGMMQLSPMRSPAPRLSAPTSTEAQEFLRKVVRDAMLEREEEQREELRALHLDMVKMGRTWKNELRTLMQEYVGDLAAIRLDNERLRAENERLRRGY